MDNDFIEDFFLLQDRPHGKNKKLVLVIYDIVSNKRRTKFVSFLEGYGLRVQKSAFEMILSDTQYNKLLGSIPQYINEEDNVRVYRLNVKGEVKTWGSNTTEQEEIIII